MKAVQLMVEAPVLRPGPRGGSVSRSGRCVAVIKGGSRWDAASGTRRSHRPTTPQNTAPRPATTSPATCTATLASISGDGRNWDAGTAMGCSTPRKPRCQRRHSSSGAIRRLGQQTSCRKLPAFCTEHVPMSAPDDAASPHWRLYRIPEAMELLSLSRTVIYEQIRAGRLRSVTQGRAGSSRPTPWPNTWRC
jgi:hypothetical protein